MESGPPDRATRIRSSDWSRPYFRMVFSTDERKRLKTVSLNRHCGVRSRTVRAKRESRKEEIWWRCRDLNPGHCGYEPHALTD